MIKRDPYDVDVPKAPEPEDPLAREKEVWRGRYGEFYDEFAPPSHKTATETVVDSPGVCILDEHGSHKRMGKHCPHIDMGHDYSQVFPLDLEWGNGGK